MREVLFRARRIDNDEWIYGDLLQNVDCVKIREQEKGIKTVAKSYTVYIETVGQYTGINDHNGEKIFEGDILQYSYTGGNKGVEGRAAVIFRKGKFGVLWGWHKEFVCLDGFCNTRIEKIGNVYDNPELMEE